MSNFPNVRNGNEGDQFTTYTTKPPSLSLGDRMIMDGGQKEFVFCQASATAVAAGKLYQTNTLAVVAGSTDADMLNAMAVVTAAVTTGSTVGVTLAGTAALSKDLLADGDLFVSAGTVGVGDCYRIKSHTAAAAGSTCTFTIYGKFKTALPAASALVGVRQNKCQNITITTADTVGTGSLIGIAPCVIAATTYGWVQTRGVCAALNGGTSMINGIPVVPSGTTAGAVSTQVASTTNTRKDITVIGVCLQAPAATTGHGLIDLKL